MWTRAAVLLGCCLAPCAAVETYSGAGTGTFYIPKFVIETRGNVKEYASMPLWQKGPGATGDTFGAYGLHFGDVIKFSIPQPVPAGSVLELTRGVGFYPGNTDPDNNRHKMTIVDGDNFPLLEFYHNTDGSTSFESSGRVYLPLDSRNTAEITVTVEAFANANASFKEFPAAYIGALGAVWKVGATHEDEQVHIVDLTAMPMSPHCTREAVPNGLGVNTTMLNGTHNFITGPNMCQCIIGLSITNIIKELTQPSFHRVVR
jgi:hypothetical protein